MEANGQVNTGLEQPVTQKETDIQPDRPYPNPFNPTTTIPFTLPADGPVKIEVYNMLGKRVATVADQQYEAGSHAVKFDATSLASGIYFVRMQLNSKISTQKITLIK